jgi:hypothetical protein
MQLLDHRYTPLFPEICMAGNYKLKNLQIWGSVYFYDGSRLTGQEQTCPQSAIGRIGTL